MMSKTLKFLSAILRPDLIEAKWTGGTGVMAWNPTSEEEKFPSDIFDSRFKETSTETKVGYLKPLLQNRLQDSVDVYVGKYKYLAVLTGAGGSATADRLADFLAHSGAVVLLQESEFSYHFSSRLRPWVHYVPLSYSASDLIEKIEWLKEVFYNILYSYI